MPKHQLGVLLERVLKQQPEVLPVEENKFYCCREGMDDWVKNRAAVKNEEIRVQKTELRVWLSEEILDKEIELTRELMQKMPQKRAAARKQGNSSTSEAYIGCEGTTCEKLQHKVWKPGEVRNKDTATDGQLRNKVWDPGRRR